MSWALISLTYSGSVKIEMGFMLLTSMPHANVLGRFDSMHFSINFLVWSGILRGWKASKNIEGLF